MDAHHLKHPLSAVKVKLAFIPEDGTRGNRTCGTFRVNLVPLATANNAAAITTTRTAITLSASKNKRLLKYIILRAPMHNRPIIGELIFHYI